MEPLTFNRLFLIHYLEIYEDHMDGTKQRLLILSFLSEGRQPPSVAFVRGLVGRQGSCAASLWTKGRASGDPRLRLSGW